MRIKQTFNDICQNNTGGKVKEVKEDLNRLKIKGVSLGLSDAEVLIKRDLLISPMLI